MHGLLITSIFRFLSGTLALIVNKCGTAIIGSQIIQTFCTCSSSQVQRSRASLVSSETGLGLPTLAQGARYYRISSKSCLSVVCVEGVNYLNVLPFRSIRWLEVTCQQKAASRHPAGWDIIQGAVIHKGGCQRTCGETSNKNERTIKNLLMVERCRIRSVSRFPGFNEIETMPSLPYLLANSLEKNTFP